MASSLRLAGAPPEPAAGVPVWAASGFRPFFLLAAAFAALIVPAWLLALHGVMRADGYLDPMTWHAHEMLVGYTGAVVAGFLLTAVGNWTSRATATGAPLIALAALWTAGRLAFAFAGRLPPAVVAAVDLAFLPALAVAIGRPLVATRNRRNYPVLAIVLALWAANLAIHLDVLGVAPGWRWRAIFVLVDLVTLLVVFFAARIFPMFTRNATGVASIRNVPWLDRAAVAAVAALALLDAARPGHAAAPWIAGAAAALTLARSVTWGARHTARNPLLWILHVGHAWIVVGLALRAAAAWLPAISMSSWVHALTVGAIGSTTLGMIARVALGHTGRPLSATRLATAAFVALTLAAMVRVLGPFEPTWYLRAMDASGALWTVAFVLYLAAYVRVLTSPRVDGKPG